MDDVKRLMEMSRQWSRDRHFLRVMAHGRSISGAYRMNELYRTANLLNEAATLLGKVILEASAEED